MFPRGATPGTGASRAANGRSRRLLPVHVQNVLVRKDEKFFGIHCRKNDFGAFGRLENIACRKHGSGCGLADRIAGVLTFVEKLGVDAHRAQATDANTLISVGDREPLGKRDRGMFGHRVRGGPDLTEQAGRRGRADEVALPALRPAWDEEPGSANVGANVDVDRRVPDVFTDVEAHATGNAGIGEVEVDRAEFLFRLRDQPAMTVSSETSPPADTAAPGRSALIASATAEAAAPSRSATTTRAPRQPVARPVHRRFPRRHR